MKLYDNKRIGLIIVSTILGICFAAYLLYEQRGVLGRTEYIVLGITLSIALTISVTVIKIGNKK